MRELVDISDDCRALSVAIAADQDTSTVPLALRTEEGIAPRKQKIQMTLFEAEKHPVLEELETLDVTALTPIEALMKLDALTRKLRQMS